MKRKTKKYNLQVLELLLKKKKKTTDSTKALANLIIKRGEMVQKFKIRNDKEI